MTSVSVSRPMRWLLVTPVPLIQPQISHVVMFSLLPIHNAALKSQIGNNKDRVYGRWKCKVFNCATYVIAIKVHGEMQYANFPRIQISCVSNKVICIILL